MPSSARRELRLPAPSSALLTHDPAPFPCFLPHPPMPSPASARHPLPPRSDVHWPSHCGSTLHSSDPLPRWTTTVYNPELPTSPLCLSSHRRWNTDVIPLAACIGLSSAWFTNPPIMLNRAALLSRTLFLPPVQPRTTLLLPHGSFYLRASSGHVD